MFPRAIYGRESTSPRRRRFEPRWSPSFEALETRLQLSGLPPTTAPDTYEILRDEILFATTLQSPPLVTEIIYEEFIGPTTDEWEPARLNLGRLGPFGNETAILQIDDLPHHEGVVVEFELAILGSWDGSFDPDRPDRFTVQAGEEVLVDASFSNWNGYRSHNQSFPHSVGEGSHPAGTGAVTPPSGQTPWSETRYRIQHQWDHVNDEMEISFTGNNLGIEQWALEWVRVSIIDHQSPFPEGVLANDVDAEGDMVTAQAVRMPEHGALLLNANGSFTYAPTKGYVGSDSFEYVAFDGETASPSTTVSITVQSPAQPPMAHPDTFVTHTGEVLVTGGDADNPYQEVFRDDFTANAALQWSRQDISVTPEGNRQFLGLFSEEQVSLDLISLPAHQLIEIELDLFVVRTWDGDEPFRFELDDEMLLETSFHSPGRGLQAYPNSLGEGRNFSGTGSSELNSLGYEFGGDHVYHLKFTRPHTSDAVRFSVSASRTEGVDNEAWGLDNVVVRVSGSVLTNDAAREGKTLTAALAEAPLNGQVALFPNGHFEYTPATGFVGFDSFRYTASDGILQSSPVTVVIEVRPPLRVAVRQEVIDRPDSIHVLASVFGVFDANSRYDLDGNNVVDLSDFVLWKLQYTSVRA